MGKILRIALACLMIGSMFGGLIGTASATGEKTYISVTDPSPWFTKGCNSGGACPYWWPHTYNGHDYISTYVGGMPGNPSQPDYWAKFRPYLSQSGKYEVYAYFYACKDTSTKVPFTVRYDGGSTTIRVNQYSSSPAWKEKYLGTWDFKAGADTYVKVTDATGEPFDGIKGLTVGAIKFVKVNQPPTCSLSADKNSGNAPLTVTFTMNASDPDGWISAWVLDVNGDGNADYSGYGNPPSTQTHTYTTSGSYSVVLMVSDNDGVSAVDTETIVVGENNPPTCSLSPDKSSGKAPLTVTFSMSASDPDGWISAWVLDVNGDGNADYSGYGNPPSTQTHTYMTSGTYTAILGVTDNEGATTFDTKTISVGPENQPLTCSLSADKNSGKAPLTVTFSMSASDPDGWISIWGLDVDGDGNAEYSGTGNPPSTQQHTYTDPGNYSVVFMVLDNDGADAFDTETVVVGENEPPTCSLTPDKSSGKASLTVTFTIAANDSDGSISSWELSPGDGSPAYSGSGNPPSTQQHTYTASGDYTAILGVTDDKGATTFDTVRIYVQPENQPPNASLSADPRSGNAPLDVTFTMSASDPHGPIAYWQLDYDDGSTKDSGTGSPPGTKTHTYQNPGTYTAKLTVTDNDGLIDYDTAMITVSEAPPEHRRPTAYASDIGGQSQTMYPDTIYSVSAKYYDPDGRDDLKYCYLQLRHPSKPLTMMWDQSDGSWSPWAGEEGANYLTITSVTNTELANGYEVTWSFKINGNWPQAENSIDFGVSARDDDDLESGWDYDNTKASFIINQRPHQPTNLFQFKSDGVTRIPIGDTTNESTVVFKGVVSDPDGDQVKLQIELRRLDEYGGQFDETKGGFKESNFVESGSEAVAYAYGLINSNYHWRARTIDKYGKASEWADFGGNDISDADFVVTVERPPVLLVHGFSVPLNLDDVAQYARGEWSFDPVKIWEEMGEVLTGIRKEEQVANTVPNRSFWKLGKRSEDGLTVYISNYTLDTSNLSVADIRLFALNLADEIEAIKKDEGVDKVDIVAHSMGGLVARAYIESKDLEILEDSYRYENLNYNDDVRKLIMLGTPNHGVSLAKLGIILGGMGCAFTSPIEFLKCLEENHYFSFVQMAPVPPVSSEPYSAFLSALNLGETGEEKEVEYSTIAGINRDCSHCNTYLLFPNLTDPLTGVTYNDCLNKCTDELINMAKRKEGGDGLVSVESVEISNLNVKAYKCLSVGHSELGTDANVCEKAKEILSNEDIGEEQSIFFGQSLPVVAVSCPVNVAIIDQYGRIINDQGTNEIPYADIQIVEEERIFYLPLDLTYNVNINGYDAGDFTLMEASPTTTEATLVNVFDNIPVTDKTKATLEIVPDEMDRIMEIDYDGDGVIDEEKSPDMSGTITEIVPPAAVADLAASDSTHNSITLTWTAPGDDGNAGTASEYDIRYSTSPITGDNWGEVTQCEGEPAPQPAGSKETFTVTGLSPGTTYYFALKTADELPNWSDLSNVPSEATQALTPGHKVYLPLIMKNHP